MTIRFHCEHCGKSLRANQEIIGRLTRCSKCGAKVRVPGESTRKSGEKNNISPPPAETIAASLGDGTHREIAASDVFDEGILSVLGDSNKFEDLSEFDLGRFDPSAYHSKPMPVRTRSQAATNQVKTADDGATIPPVSPLTFHRKKSLCFPTIPKLSKRSLLLGGLLSIVGLLSLGMLAYWFTLDNFTLETSELYQSGMGSRYKSVLTELKRSQGALATMQKAHVSKGLPSDELAQANLLMQRFAQTTEGHPGLRAAERKLRAGDEKEGRKMFHLEIEALLTLKADVDSETERLKERTFSNR